MDFYPHASSFVQENQSDSSPLRLMEYLTGMMTSRCLHVAAQLAIADALSDTPQTSEALAAATNTYAPYLTRLLRALAAHGIFQEVAEEQFAHTQLSRYLRSDMPGSMRPMVLMWGDMLQWDCWAVLAHCIKTGDSGIQHVHGMDMWTYMSQVDTTYGKNFHDAMTSFSLVTDNAIVAAYDTTAYKTLVDVGGGQGNLLFSLLAANPDLQGILFDQPAVIAQVALPDDLKSRCQLVAGDFFKEIPAGADCYIAKQITQDWNDEECIQILSNIKTAMTPQSKIVVIDQVITPENDNRFAALLDIQMFVTLTGRERTQSEFADLFARAGLSLHRAIPTALMYTLLEGAIQ